MNRSTEMVLFYSPAAGERSGKLKSVFVRQGIRIRNIAPEQMEETVGYLAGMEGFGPRETAAEAGEKRPEPPSEEVLIMKNFTSRRIDELLLAIRKAGLSRVELKAVVTPTNAQWSFYRLYEEIREEREKILEQVRREKEKN